MSRSGEVTRERILGATEALVFEHGFAAASIDKLLERTGLTKGAFFYHFKSKAALGRALLERYALRDMQVLEDTMARAEKLSDDPLQQILIFVGLLREPLERLAEPAPGCLFASFAYQPMAFHPEIAALAAATMLTWRRRIAAKFVRAVEQHPPRSAVEPGSLADHLLAIIEGSYVLSKVLADAGVPARQLAHYRCYVETLFRGG
jgi:TetR/AcrR family transcriptional regulator, transcriptional repressor for nem operon